ncbi:putative cyclin-dependent kinase F-2 [Hordeum vulgare subsp. vulgare]|uniref:putative cyclin-dependent kinase F-2 n=1 Tax=Hordeum vulgare subsp. vulgare TaxID=112509 RepID=UPI001D1A4DB1|nr:putative cyclin-dependent kinase F-2 [Hordeum vulgare subsp. vulgare]
MAARKRPAAALDAFRATTTQHQQSATSRSCKRSRAFIGCTDDYQQVECLGKGGFGVVLRVRHKVTKKDLAVKFLSSPDDTEEGADVEDLHREAGFLEACQGNPYVVGFEGMVHDLDAGDVGLAMEYVEGSSLESLLWDRRDGPPLPESMVRDFMWKLLNGAEKMHDRHVVHRDIKPGNILVGETGELVKICDLGLAISMSDKPPYNQAGTSSYMAPEMIMGKRDYDALVDSWSIGCVFAELLTGATLFMLDDEDEEKDRTKNAIKQLGSIFRVLGVPDERTWPGCTSLPLTVKAPQLLQERHKHNRLRDLFPEEKLSEEGFQVLQGLLTCNPDKRLTAAAALKRPWFAVPRSAAAAASTKADALSFPKRKAPRIKFIPPAMPEKNVLKIPLAVWNATQRV